MGIEYTLRTTQGDHASVQLALSRLEGAVASRKDSREIEFRSASPRGDSMPDAVLQVETTSVYFRDNGGNGRNFLGAVIAALCAFGSVTVEEL